MRPLELDHPNRVLANEPGFECSPAGPSDCLPRMRKTRPDITILALFRSPALRMNRTARLLSLGRTLPESRLRRVPFGILSRCQLPRPNCQRTKRAVGASACGATHWRLVSLSWTEVRLDASSRASTHDAHRRSPPHQQRDPRRPGPHEQERGNRTPTTQDFPGFKGIGLNRTKN